MASSILLRFYKVDNLPNVLEEDAIYIVQDLDSQTASITITDSLGNPFFSVAGALANTITEEVPSGLINGSNATFTTVLSFVPASIQVFVNGLRQKKIDDYVTTGVNTIILSASPKVGDSIIVSYIQSA